MRNALLDLALSQDVVFFCKIQVDNLASVTEVSLAWSVGYGSNQARLTTMFRFSVATWIGNAAAV